MPSTAALARSCSASPKLAFCAVCWTSGTRGEDFLRLRAELRRLFGLQVA